MSSTACPGVAQGIPGCRHRELNTEVPGSEESWYQRPRSFYRMVNDPSRCVVIGTPARSGSHAAISAHGIALRLWMTEREVREAQSLTRDAGQSAFWGSDNRIIADRTWVQIDCHSVDSVHAAVFLSDLQALTPILPPTNVQTRSCGDEMYVFGDTHARSHQR